MNEAVTAKDGSAEALAIPAPIPEPGDPPVRSDAAADEEPLPDHAVDALKNAQAVSARVLDAAMDYLKAARMGGASNDEMNTFAEELHECADLLADIALDYVDGANRMENGPLPWEQEEEEEVDCCGCERPEYSVVLGDIICLHCQLPVVFEDEEAHEDEQDERAMRRAEAEGLPGAEDEPRVMVYCRGNCQRAVTMPKSAAGSTTWTCSFCRANEGTSDEPPARLIH